MSAAGPRTLGKPMPRWSVVRFNGLLPALITGLPDSGACVRDEPPLKASGPSFGSTAVKLPVPLTEILHVEQIDSINEFVASTVNDGTVVVLVARSAVVALLLARIDDTILSVGGAALLAPGGLVAPVVIKIPPVRLFAATLSLIVELSSSTAILP